MAPTWGDLFWQESVQELRQHVATITEATERVISTEAHDEPAIEALEQALERALFKVRAAL